jgi:2-amino-4-hydroxy-6-hydroxymethyldihydropteridine diphosphokinase
MGPVVRTYLGLGSNLGDRLANLQGAVDGLGADTASTVVGVSSVYETDPVGGPEQPAYLNAVVVVDTSRSPRQLLELAQALEARARRVRRERWGPRTLDVDLLLFGDAEVHEPDLEVPHPRMGERGFVIAPLAEVRGRSTVPTHEWTGVRKTDLSLKLP